MVNKIIAGKPKAEIIDGNFVLTSSVSGAVSGECFYSIPEQYQSWIDPERSDCFLVGLLYSAMFAGAELQIEGTVSEMLLFRTNTYTIPLLHGLDPRLKKIRVSADAVSSLRYSDADINGAGFSGGIDSFYTIWKRSGAETPENFRINTLFFFNVGSHGMGSNSERLKFLEDKFAARFNVLKGFADEVKMPLVPINSNIHSFHQSGHLQTSTLASFSAALFVGKRIKNYYLGSPGFDYYDLIRTKDTFNADIGMINDYLMPNLSTESFTAIIDGNDASRTEKTRKLLAYDPIHRYLNVCANQNTIEKNCSVCYKCHRTMMTFDLLGCLDEFSRIFDLAKYGPKERRRYAAEILNDRKHDPFLDDIYKLAKRTHHNLRDDTNLPTRLYMKFTHSRLFAALRDLKHRN